MKKKPSVPESREDFQKLGAELVHDVATPLASLQLNVQSLNNYLPLLLACYENKLKAEEGVCAIPATQLDALARLPEAIEGDVQKLRSLSKKFMIKMAGSQAVPPAPWEDLALSESAEKCQQTAGPTVKTTATRCLSAPLRLLLVEDEKVHRDIVLQQLGPEFIVDCAGNGPEALARSRQNAYDLVLLDFFLPGTDAHALLNRLQPLLPDRAHVIGFSNMLDEQSPEGLFAQVSACLEKPFRLENFWQVLKELRLAPLAETGGNEK